MLKQILWPILALLSSSSLQALDCGTAQRQLLSLSEENQDRLQIENREYSDLQSFVTSKPELAPARIVTGSLTVQGEAYEQLWCKMKSQEAVLAIAKVSSEGPALDCRDLNRKQLEEALGDIQDDHSQSSLESLGIQLESDKDFSTGAQWAPSKLGMSKSDGVIRIQAMRLKSATWIPIVGGMNYCK
ncbi:MAG: hypothetical protein NTX25_07190, partial [Proteobacteria bacterium]|nr:hypothetical protein [Pseudomonadota bacterium]